MLIIVERDELKLANFDAIEDKCTALSRVSKQNLIGLGPNNIVCIAVGSTSSNEVGV